MTFEPADGDDGPVDPATGRPFGMQAEDFEDVERTFEDVESGGPGGAASDAVGWPDRYMFDINIRATRVEALVRVLLSLLPGRVFPIIDVMGNDAYREIDPYIAYDLVGIERFLDGVKRFKPWLFEDGLVGFGAMSEEPFMYVFVDEHKIVTVRVEAALREKVERLLACFDLQALERLTGVDSVVHEHRGVLDAPSDRPELLTHDEIIEELRDEWGLVLNVDTRRNTDDEGNELGLLPWRCVVRAFVNETSVRYVETIVAAENLLVAQELAMTAAEELLAEEGELESEPTTEGTPDKPAHVPSRRERRVERTADGARIEPVAKRPTSNDGKSDESKDKSSIDPLLEFDVLTSDRFRPEDLVKVLPDAPASVLKLDSPRVVAARWLE